MYNILKRSSSKDDKILKEVIYDAMSDFLSENPLDINIKRIANSLVSKMGWSVEEYGEEECYALVKEFMYCYLLDESSKLKNIKGNKLDAIIEEYLSKPIEWHIERNGIFKWEPKILDEVRKDGKMLFEIAKESYFKHCFEDSNTENIEKANNIFERMLSVREILEKEDYRYRSKRAIIDLYEQEISESQLDLAVIVENRLFMSFRLENYLYELKYCEPDTFELSCNPPFYMPEDLFKPKWKSRIWQFITNKLGR